MNAGYREHTNNLFLENNLLKLNEINIYSTCVFILKSLNAMSFPINYFHFNVNNFYNLKTAMN